MSALFGLDLLNFGRNVINDIGNYSQQNWANLKNERLMREAWSREDSAVQRRAADLQAAGINPMLAAGQAATSMSPISVNAPQMKGRELGAIALARQDAEIGVTNAQKELIREQISNERADRNLRIAELEKRRLDTEERRYNFEMARKEGLRSDINSGLAGQLQQLFGYLADKGLGPANIIKDPLGYAGGVINSVGGVAGNAIGNLKAKIEKAAEQGVNVLLNRTKTEAYKKLPGNTSYNRGK